MTRRISAAVALVLLMASIVLLVLTALDSFPRGLLFVVLLVAALLAAWQALVRRGWARIMLWVAVGMLAVAMVILAVGASVSATGIAALALLAAAALCARHAFSVDARLDEVDAPHRAVVVYNAKSGGGKAVSSNLAAEARKRGMDARELLPGEDWEQVVRDLVAHGADGLAAAGGDGTQALVAGIAAEHDLPFACIPAGTRNHFALDLGVDRDDVVGALDAFVDGGEKRVDLGDVDGRVFVNNVSLGVYADAVQQEGYRDAKARTLLETARQTLGPQAGGPELRWTGPDGAEHSSAAVILVSNNAYRLGRVFGEGTRPRLDQGILGIAAAGGPGVGSQPGRVVTQWTSPEYTVTSDDDIPVGVDGEALLMSPTIVLRSRPGALRVRIAPQHPGVSPSAAAPSGLVDTLSTLFRVVALGTPVPLAVVDGDRRRDGQGSRS